MKFSSHKLLIPVCAFLLLFNLQAKKTDLAKNKLNHQQLSFKENLGQVSDQNYKPRPDVLFSGSTGNLCFHLKKDGISYQLNRVDSWKEEQDVKTKNKTKYADQYTIYRIDMNWLNTNSTPIIKKTGKLEAYDNYYLSTCPNGALNVRSYNQITYQQIYDGIDVTWYEKNGNLKYDYTVAAGADYKQIQIEIKGATKISINAHGELEIVTPLGTIVEQSPLVFQNKKTLPARWKINDNKLSFEIDNINPDLPFIIDPAVRVWGTYFGEASDASYCTTSNKGEVYMFGYIQSSLFNIATGGAHQTTLAGSSDAFVVKFNPGGTRIWCTYYGGSEREIYIYGATDTTGNVYLTGITVSYTDAVIATPGSHQPVFANQNLQGEDAFLVKFNSSGVRQWGTYYGGIGDDNPSFCVTDNAGNVYICGHSNSSNDSSIATAGSHQYVFGGGLPASDCFLVKFNSGGVRQWATYYGGNTSDVATSCLVDNSGSIFLSGHTATNSNSIIATPGSHQATFNSSGLYDTFLAKFNSSGVRQWGTYYGGEGNDFTYASCMDSNGNVFLTGKSQSSTGISTTGAFQANVVTGSDAFLSKFNTHGLLQWGTFYSVVGEGLFCAVNPTGDIYFGGSTSVGVSNVTTPGSHQTTFGGGLMDVYLAKFNNSGVRLWGTFYGGSNDDYGGSVCVNSSGNIFMCGSSASCGDTSIATLGSFQDTILSTTNLETAFLVRFNDTDISTVSLSEETLHPLDALIFPNPACENITLLLDDPFLETKIYRLSIVNYLGQVCQEILIKNEESRININLSDLPNGMYNLTAKGNNSTITSKKFIISR